MNESRLELSVMELFKNIDYETLRGEEILRETTDVLIKDDLRAFLAARYSADGITAHEIENIIFGLVRAAWKSITGLQSICTILCRTLLMSALRVRPSTLR